MEASINMQLIKVMNFMYGTETDQNEEIAKSQNILTDFVNSKRN